jgi:hypothetical protein
MGAYRALFKGVTHRLRALGGAVEGCVEADGGVAAKRLVRFIDFIASLLFSHHRSGW